MSTYDSSAPGNPVQSARWFDQAGGRRTMKDLVVVELAGSSAGAFCAKLLGDLGAMVVCIEPAGGAPLRANAAAWAAFCTSRITIPHGAPIVAEWLARADVVIESTSDAPLPDRFGGDPSIEANLASDAIRVRLSPFGASGPYSAWLGADILDQALGGHLYLSGMPHREPIKGPSGQAALASGVYGAIGAMAALHARDRGFARTGQTVEATHHEALASLHQFTDVRYTHARNILKRLGNRYAGPGSPIGMYKAADGFMALTVSTSAHAEMLLAITGLDRLLEHPDVNSVTDLMVNAPLFEPAFNKWLGEQPVAETVELFQSARIAAGPVLGMQQVLADPHLEAREWWQETVVDGQSVRMPGAPFRIEGMRWTGAAAVEGDPSIAPPARTDRPLDSTTHDPDRGIAKRPLEGLRVLDLTRVWAGPLAARILSELGADVVMVEAPWARTPGVMPESYVQASHFFPDDDQFPNPWNRHGFVNKFALTKRSVGLELNTPDGPDVLRHLIANADVLIENYSPRVMPNLGFSDAQLKEINPNLIYVTMPGYGRTGPAKDYSAYGPVIDSHAGLSALMGYPDTGPWKCGIAWPDPVAGIHAAFAVLAALWERAETGQPQGRTVEIPQFETAVSMISDRLIESQLRGTEPAILGNRHELRAPQGVYRCSGDDHWLSLTVNDDAMWQNLCARIDAPVGWSAWNEATRRTNHDDIDHAINAWTATRSPSECADALQTVGVAAAPVADAEMMMNDPHLHARGYFVDLTHPEAGTQSWGPTCAARLSITPAAMPSAAPCLGEGNREILRSWAGLDEASIDDLINRGVVADRPAE